MKPNILVEFLVRLLLLCAGLFRVDNYEVKRKRKNERITKDFEKYKAEAAANCLI